jgi:hypothetical protein
MRDVKLLDCKSTDLWFLENINTETLVFIKKQSTFATRFDRT